MRFEPVTDHLAKSAEGYSLRYNLGVFTIFSPAGNFIGSTPKTDGYKERIQAIANLPIPELQTAEEWLLDYSKPTPSEVFEMDRPEE